MKRFAALLAAAALMPGAASAQPIFEARRVAIPTAGIALTDPAAVANLRKRITRAAQQVCREYDRTSRAQQEWRRCKAAAIENANRQLDRLVIHSRRAAALADRGR